MAQAVDRLELTVLVDNATDSLSSVPSHVETEFNSHWRRGMRVLSGKCLCCAAHGLSCLITAYRGDAARTMLFDTGPEEWVFERNVTRLGVDLGRVEAMVLSHGHWDHAGAMPRALQMITQQSSQGANGGRNVPVYMHPEMFALRAFKQKDGGFAPMELVPGVDVLSGNGGDVVVTRDAQSVL